MMKHPHPLPLSRARTLANSARGQADEHRRGEKKITQDIGYLAERVIRGDRVAVDLSDGTFVALMEELRRRGWVLQGRAEYDPERRLNPFVVRVRVRKAVDRNK